MNHQSYTLKVISCILVTHLMAAHICFSVHPLYHCSFPLPNSTFSHIGCHEFRQAPPPTQILCHPAATNCDASVCVSATHLSIVEHSRLTIRSPRVASLQHIFSKLASESEALRFNLRGPHPQIHTCVDPTTHAASPARAPHQRHDHHLQTAQNIRPR